jgi:acetyl esterase/lipase
MEMPSPGPGAVPPPVPGIYLSATVAESDLSTSTMLDASDAPPIDASEDGLTLVPDVTYATRTLADGRELPLRLDVFTHSDGRPRPVVLYVPGGGFVVALKDMMRDHRAYVARAGFVVASLEYRALSHGPGVTYADSVQDVKEALRFLRAHSARFGIDPARAGVWGESAGGYLAAMTGVTSGTTEFAAGDHPGQSSDVHAVVDKFGPSSLADVAEDFDAGAQEFWTAPDGHLATYVHGPGGGLVDASDEDFRRANPIRYVHKESPPFLFFHGSADVMVSPSQTLRLHNALREAGVASERLVLPGGGHGDQAFLGADPVIGAAWSSTAAIGPIADFFRTTLR